MHIRVVAVGDRLPAWVNQAFADYAQRLPRQWRFNLKTVPVAKRSRNQSSAESMAIEGDALLRECSDSDRVVVLDERGKQYSTTAFSRQLEHWQADGRDVCLLIGGPDGLSAECLERANEQWSLSALTLPHGLARVLMVEQLYRAWSLANGHPYHRE